MMVVVPALALLLAPLLPVAQPFQVNNIIIAATKTTTTGWRRTTSQQLRAAEAASEEGVVQIRDWERGDGGAILNLLMMATEEDGSSFNPEGPLNLDCTDESLLNESYNTEDGGCFLVAVYDDGDFTNNMIVGTAGLILGTQVQYLKSGASLSSPEIITAAVRRCCSAAAAAADNNTISNNNNGILEQLLGAIERRAILGSATKLIALGFPADEDSAAAAAAARKPTPQLLEKLGYQPLPQQLSGFVDIAVQYGKDLA